VYVAKKMLSKKQRKYSSRHFVVSAGKLVKGKQNQEEKK